MTDWFGDRSGSYTFRRVKWPSWEEAEDYGNVTGGTIERSALSDVKDSGSLTFVGDAPPNGDLVRIYYNLGGESRPMATMFAACEEPTLAGGYSTGTLDLTGALSVLANRKHGAPYTVAAGTNAVGLAAEIAEGCGLVVNNPGASSYAVGEDHTFEVGDSYLKVVNWLLDAAGYASACTDERGAVCMLPYVEPTGRTPSFEFEDGERSIMLPEVVRSCDLSDTPNVARLWYSTDEESLYASCSNVDPDSPVSLPSLAGREQTLVETVSELSGDTQAERIANLKAMAEAKLVDNSAQVEYVKLKHPWVPIAPNDAVGVRYSAAGLEWRGSVTNMRTDLSADAMCETSARRFVRTSFKTKTEGGVA